MDKNNYHGSDYSVIVNGVSYTHDDISFVVDDFYTRIQNDAILSVPFKSVADWPEHIERLTHFWWVRFGGKPYLFNYYNPVAKHFFAGFNRDLLQRWLVLFHETLKNRLTGDQADLWKAISERMGEALAAKNELFRREYESQQHKFGTNSAEL